MFGVNDYTKPIIDYGNFEFSQLGSAAGFGGSMVLIGMATIFSVLCVIWGCLVLFKLFFHDLPEKKKSNKTAAPVIEVTDTVASPSSNSDEEEIVAVIAAAIAMAESEFSGTKFRVVSFKRK